MRGRHFPITAKEISVIMNVSERTIYRDIISLQSAGAHIDGEAGVGYILRKETFLPPLMLTEEEAESLLLGLR
jgi:predicted DNA-binding transcriptional regulator YafY